MEEVYNGDISHTLVMSTESDHGRARPFWKGTQLMNSHAHPRRHGLHLVTAAAATISKPAALECEALPPERPQPDQVEARQVAERILEYRTLQDELMPRCSRERLTWTMSLS